MRIDNFNFASMELLPVRYQTFTGDFPLSIILPKFLELERNTGRRTDIPIPIRIIQSRCEYKRSTVPYTTNVLDGGEAPA